MRSHLLSAAVVLTLASAGLAADPAKNQVVTRTFSVADLVVPVPDYIMPVPGTKPGPAERWKKPTVSESAAQLVRLVTATVRPGSWEKAGGNGTIAFAEAGYALTVTTTPEAMAEVAALIEGMRRLQDVCVSCDVKLLKVPAGLLERAGLQAAGDSVLTDCQVRAVVETIQRDRDASVTQYPKITVFDGQVATVRSGEQIFVASEVQTSRKKGGVVFVPKNTPVDLGDTLVLCGRLSADEKSVTLRAHLTRTTRTGPNDQVPVTARITPVFEGGSQGMPVPVTQLLQVPQLKTTSMEKTAVVSDGGTVVLGRWKESGGETKMSPPVTSNVPYLDRLFKTVGPANEFDVVVLATVRVIRETGETALRPVPAVCPVAPMPREVMCDDEVKGACAAETSSAGAGSPRLVQTCPRVAPPTPLAGSRASLLPDMEVAVADANVALALADQSPPNRDDLLDMARTRYQRALAKDPHNAAAVRGLNRLTLVAAYINQTGDAQAPIPATASSLPAAFSPVRARQAIAPESTPEEAVVVRMTIAKVPAGFVKDAGLADEKAGDLENKWVLADLETRLLTAVLRRDKSSEICARPTISLNDGQTGCVRIALGNKRPFGATTRLTPGVMADGKQVVLKVETGTTDEAGEEGSGFRTIVEKVPIGCTLVLRGAAVKMPGAGASELLILMTVDRQVVTSPPAVIKSIKSVEFRR